nr:hypothetical protein [Tanacetum cinerariifolium]
MSVKYPTYVNPTSLSKEHPNERTPSPHHRKKSLLPPQGPPKSISSKSTHYTSSSSPNYKRTNAYLPRIHRSRKMDEDLRESYRTLEKRLFHEGRFVTPSFIEANNMLLSFQAIGLESLLTLNEPICPRFVAEFYHSLEVKRDEEERLYIKFKLGQFIFELNSTQLSQNFQTPYAIETFTQMNGD